MGNSIIRFSQDWFKGILVFKGIYLFHTNNKTNPFKGIFDFQRYGNWEIPLWRDTKNWFKGILLFKAIYLFHNKYKTNPFKGILAFKGMVIGKSHYEETLKIGSKVFCSSKVFTFFIINTKQIPSKVFWLSKVW